jgi:hypothetical protein
MITSNIGSLNENMTVQYLVASEREEKKCNGFKKLGSHQLRVILNATSIDSDVSAGAPT